MADYVNADRVFSVFQSMTDSDWDAVVSAYCVVEGGKIHRADKKITVKGRLK